MNDCCTLFFYPGLSYLDRSELVFSPSILSSLCFSLPQKQTSNFPPASLD